MKNARLIVVFAVFAAMLVALVLILVRSSGYYFGGGAELSARQAAAVQASPTPKMDPSFPFAEIFNAESTTEDPNKTWADRTIEITLRLLLAVVLSAILAFRPRKNVPLFQRTHYVSQTQILLAVVAAALMMIVGDNAARAFAIFAAVSLVRFRTNIRDPKEITVLLISLALGLAAGVGRWELGIALCLFALALLWLLEYNESTQVYRSMDLAVKTRNTDSTQEILQNIFKRSKIVAEVRQIDPPDETNPIGNIMYYLNLRLNLTTDYLSEQIMAADPENIEGIQWVKTRSATDIYQ